MKTEPKLDIFDESDANQAAFRGMSPDRLADYLTDAPEKADLLASTNVKNALWEMPPHRAQTAAAIALKRTGLSIERQSMLWTILGSALRREGTPRAKEAAEALDKAAEANRNLRSMDPSWANRIQEAIDYEHRQVLPHVGLIEEASALNLRKAEQALRELRPDASPEDRFRIFFQMKRIGLMQAVEAAYAFTMDEDFRYQQEASLQAGGNLTGLKNRLEEDLRTNKQYNFWLIQLKLDRVKLAWIAGEEGDFLRDLQWITERMAEDQNLKTAYDVYFRVAMGMNALTSGVIQVNRDALTLATSVALDPKIGIEWRADAFAVAAELSYKLGKTLMGTGIGEADAMSDAAGLCGQLFDIVRETGWRSAAVGKAAAVYLAIDPIDRERLYQGLYPDTSK